MLEYPVTPGLIFCLDRAFPYALNEIIVEKAIAYRGRGVVGIDIAGRRAGRSGPGTTDGSSTAHGARAWGSRSTPVKPGPSRRSARSSSSSSRPHRSRCQGGLRSAHDGHDPGTRHRARGLPDQQPQHARGLGLGRVPLDLRTFRRNGVRFTINTDGPEMLKTYIRDELTSLGRLGILSHEEQAQSVEWARQASFVEGVSDMRCRSVDRPAAAAGARRSLGRSAGAEWLDAVGAHPIPARDMRLPDDIGAEHLAVELELGCARLRMPRGDVVDRAIGLPHAECLTVRAGGFSRRAVAQVALLILDDSQLADSNAQASCIDPALGEPLTDEFGLPSPRSAKIADDERDIGNSLQRVEEAGRQARVVEAAAPGRRRSGRSDGAAARPHAVPHRGPRTQGVRAPSGVRAAAPRLIPSSATMASGDAGPMRRKATMTALSSLLVPLPISLCADASDIVARA